VSDSSGAVSEPAAPGSDLSSPNPTNTQGHPGSAPAVPWNVDLALADGEVVAAAELARVELLRGVAPESVGGALERCVVKMLEAGEMLIEADGVDSTVYLVLSGRLAVLGADGEPEDFLEAGRTIGEMAVLDRAPALSAIQAHVDTRLLAIGEEAFWGLAWGSHEFAVNVLAHLPRRVGGSGISPSEGMRQRRTTDRESPTDALTGCRNRRWMDDMFPRFIKRHAFAKTPLSLLFIDLDHFKRFNEKNGHLQGDCALSAVARAIVEGLRPMDVIARYGGEEFLVMLPGAPLEGARIAAERLRACIAGTKIAGGDGGAIPSVTVSIAAITVAPGEAPASAMARATELLYRAKLAGRNRVESA
jgi:diguanylate cyclase (GGDEF)-like protein